MKHCELCNGEATIYCPSDSALLCSNCDANVHAANFLVARHLRFIICSNCTTTLPITTSTCNSLSLELQLQQEQEQDCISSTDDHDHDQSSSSSSSNSNKMEVVVNSKYNDSSSVVVDMDWKAEAVLVNWGNKLGITNRNVTKVACHAFGMCNVKLPYRVGLAASLWLSLKSDSKLQLKRLEEICGVPWKIILAAHTKLARNLKMKSHHHHRHRQQLELEEGWAES